jgi:hypothetical protein
LGRKLIYLYFFREGHWDHQFVAAAAIAAIHKTSFPTCDFSKAKIKIV